MYVETRLGIVTDELKSICEKIRPFAVVMGTKGASACARNVHTRRVSSQLQMPGN